MKGDPYQTSIRNFGPSRPRRASTCCTHSYCTTYTNDPSGLCPGHRNFAAAFYGQQAARRLQWIDEADYTNPLNCELFASWQREAVRYAIAAAHEAGVAPCAS